MKLRSLSKSWRVRRAPLPLPGTIATATPRKNKPARPPPLRTKVVEWSEDNFWELEQRLFRAAEKFWPRDGHERRADRVSNTVCEAIARLRKGEQHTISWWAKFMWGTSVDAIQANREDTKDGSNVDLWGGSVPETQTNHIFLQQTISMAKFLPEPERSIFDLLVDGANIIEIATETKTSVDRVIHTLDNIRKWMDDGGAYFDVDQKTSDRMSKGDDTRSVR